METTIKDKTRPMTTLTNRPRKLKRVKFSDILNRWKSDGHSYEALQTLATVSENDGELEVRQIAALRGVDRKTANRQVINLRDARLITATESRPAFVSITDYGAEVIAAFRGIAH